MPRINSRSKHHRVLDHTPSLSFTSVAPHYDMASKLQVELCIHKTVCVCLETKLSAYRSPYI